MIRFRNRNDLLEWLEGHAPRLAIQRAMLSGQVEVLGGFTKLLPSTHSGWAVKVTSKTQTYLVAIVLDEKRHTYRSFGLRKIPWEYWCGIVGSQHPSIYDGDYPTKYKVLSNEAKKLAADKPND